MTEKEPIYRILFKQGDQLKTLYSRYLTEDTLESFIELETLVFPAAQEAGAVVDESASFKHVDRVYLPIHVIVRIDELSPQVLFDMKIAGGRSNVTQLPTLKQEKPPE